MSDTKIWGCKIGECVEGDLRPGVDEPMREAVTRAYRLITGKEPTFLFSGWGEKLTESERAVVENRLPSDEYERDWHEKERELTALRAELAELKRVHSTAVPSDFGAYTPGPWRLIDATGDELAITTDDRMDSDIVPIVEVEINWEEAFDMEQRANARLIAAAPELAAEIDAAWDALGKAQAPATDHIYDSIRQLAEERDALAAELAEKDKDAKRLDWLILQIEEPIVPRFWYANREDYLFKYRVRIDKQSDQLKEK